MRWAENAGYKKAFTVFCEGFLCPEPDSNQHTLRHMHLKHASTHTCVAHFLKKTGSAIGSV